MVGLAIQPHSRRDNHFALLALGLIAAGSFALGVGRQIAPAGPSPFPQTTLTAPQRAAAIPDATPAPTLQVAETRPSRRAEAEPAPPDITDDIPAAPPVSVAAPATDTAAADTSTVAPEPQEPAPTPIPDAPPT